MEPTNPQLQPLGVAWAVWSGVTVLIGLCIALVAAGVGGLITAIPESSSGEPAPWWMGMFFGGFGLAIGGAVLLMGVLGIVVGVGVTRGRRWALFAACALGLLHVSSFPIGTLLGVWTFVVAGRELSKPTG
ncbi:MAG: hypothetical protein Q8P18_23020 [Pseudomonadota bacterium]|nr:hypothetical protein [Pseudomonadota bacterium]